MRETRTPDAKAPIPPTKDAVAPLVVGTVARLSPQKGIGHLVEAAELVLDALSSSGGGEASTKALGRGVRFAVAGDGPLEAGIVEDVRRRGLSERFELVGGVPSPWEFLKGLDLFVLPSIYEGDAFALKEAMGAGLPVVATDVGGVRDAIPDARYGRVVAPEDPRALSRAIAWFLLHPWRREFCGRNARCLVEERFSVERMVGETELVYLEALAA